MTEDEEPNYIELLAERSKTSQHELIEEMLIYYKVHGTRDLTKEQIKSYALERTGMRNGRHEKTFVCVK